MKTKCVYLKSKRLFKIYDLSKNYSKLWLQYTFRKLRIHPATRISFLDKEFKNIDEIQ